MNVLEVDEMSEAKRGAMQTDESFSRIVTLIN